MSFVDDSGKEKGLPKETTLGCLPTKGWRNSGGFDLVFLSPPYKMGSQKHLLKHLAKIITPQGVVIFDHAKETEIPNNIDSLQKVRSRTYGATEISILAKTG